MKKRILVLAEDYPDNNGKISLMYIHTRNLEYVKAGIDVTVLNFRSKENYNYEGINVISQVEYKTNGGEYDLLILHAANIKHHYRFLKKYGKRFKRFFFFFHGHEVLRINQAYSKPYSYVRKSKLMLFAQDVYDTLKLYIWRRYLPKVKEKSAYIFVSKWMYDNFFKWTKIKELELEGHMFITYNCVGDVFEKEKYNDMTEKEYDFITIRSFMDGSKYSVDIVNRLAFNTPEANFLMIGKGEFFKHYKKAPNLTWLDMTLSHSEIVEQLQRARFALMPTRTDAQGLMMCEMAAFGIPIITSDIQVCHEVFSEFENVYFIDNDDHELNLSNFSKIKSRCKKDDRFYKKKTIKKELEIFNEVINS